MDNFKTVLDLGSKNLRLAVYDQNSKNIYSSKEIIIDNLEIGFGVLPDETKF